MRPSLALLIDFEYQGVTTNPRAFWQWTAEAF